MLSNSYDPISLKLNEFEVGAEVCPYKVMASILYLHKKVLIVNAVNGIININKFIHLKNKP